ncbi:MAG: aldo/keto reductase [bacterium]
MLLKRLALGTVQFGLPYGIANRVGKLTEKEAFTILELAHKEGIDTLDTAYSYGESEEIIGEFISQSGKNFNIISKLPYLEKEGISNKDVSVVEKYCAKTLNRLKQPQIYGYLVHKFDNILKYKDLWKVLESLKQRGLISKIGASLYRPDELEYLLNNHIHFDIIQVPYNIFDQRFDEYFPILKKMGVEIYTRSVFLQGLFFLEMDRIDKDFKPARDKVAKLRGISAGYNIPLNSLCLCFVLLNSFIDRVIIGIDSMEHLKQNVASVEYLDKVENLYELVKSLKIHDEQIILPYNWKARV